MDKPWENDSCASIKAHYAVYSIPEAAALWCGVTESELKEIITQVKQVAQKGIGRSIYNHPNIPCIEPRSRAIAEAVEKGDIPHGREDGVTIGSGDPASYERRHILGRDLKKWMELNFPNEKPAFLFDDIERAVNSGISQDDYLVLKAKNDALEERLQNAERWYRDNKSVSTKGHNAYRDVIVTLAEVILGQSLTGKPNTDAKALIQAVESKGKALPGEKTVANYLTSK